MADGSGGPRGDVAQLAEHLLCKQGASGSSPLISSDEHLVRTNSAKIEDRWMVRPGVR